MNVVIWRTMEISKFDRFIVYQNVLSQFYVAITEKKMNYDSPQSQLLCIFFVLFVHSVVLRWFFLSMISSLAFTRILTCMFSSFVLEIWQQPHNRDREPEITFRYVQLQVQYQAVRIDMGSTVDSSSTTNRRNSYRQRRLWLVRRSGYTCSNTGKITWRETIKKFAIDVAKVYRNRCDREHGSICPVHTCCTKIIRISMNNYWKIRAISTLSTT